MPSFVDIQALKSSYLEQMGCSWHKDEDGEYIVKDKLLVLTQKEVRAYYDVTNELYKMYEAGAAYVIEKELFFELDIPECLIESVQYSWKNERENHLYGRFDLSGGLDATEIKLIEFNADTPTLLLESSLIQWMLLEQSGLEHKEQFNAIYEKMVEKMKKISSFERGVFSRMLLSSVKNIDEERETVQLLQKIASDAGVSTNFSYLEDIAIGKDAIYDVNENRYDFFFKLYPWEDMQGYEQSMTTKILNPAYTLLFQSKGMLAILSKLFPESPYLLKSSFEPLDVKYVKKRMFGREGANIDIVGTQGELLVRTQGIYEQYKPVYQEYTPFVQDTEGYYYQAGIFYSGEASGVGFRRGAEILDDMSQFIGHCVLDK